MTGTKKDLEAFASRLRRTRQAAHLSQVALAEKVGISNKQLNNVENAHNWPSMPVYLNLCRVLELGEPPLLKDAA
jgi:transcriptional regulator with XRE-family HTH domain